MKKTWQIQEAKVRFNEVLKEARCHGPQHITQHGELVAVIVSKNEYEKLKGLRNTLLHFIQDSPLYGVELNIGR